MSDFFPEANQPGLFATSAWINAWEESWGDLSGISKENLGLNSDCSIQEDDNWYSYIYTPAKPLRFKTIFLAGASTTAARSLRSEYFYPPSGCMSSLFNSAFKFSWDQLWIPDLISNSPQHKELLLCAKRFGLDVVVRDSATSYAVSLKETTFSEYLASLSGSTRLKLFNKRKRLVSLGRIEVRNVWPHVNGFLDVLNGFHLQRWGKVCYEGRNRKLITDFLHNISSEGGEIDLSIIYQNEKPISAVLDVAYQQRIYNVQSGYLEKFSDGISLGTLHFGYQIEKAFTSPALFYDFMAGDGKNSNYKKLLANAECTFISSMVVRSFPLKVLYWIKRKLE
ncbi:GNAT family N-acetyltransferase [Cellvibrio sp. NN19]|uniref:GNAT family N-acetyltransferase n=1 Tax=Cellvibrio chitinivorans TaxID=3102792 RepID=UPI002B41584D|nr:GNAT family N-acetyltransferase [Cellvibrio sp. NN19]